jgi:hypothetical protein
MWNLNDSFITFQNQRLDQNQYKNHMFLYIWGALVPMH